MSNYVDNIHEEQITPACQIANSSESRNIQSQIPFGSQSSDVKSTTTMAGTLNMEKSEKIIQDAIDSRTDTQGTENNNDGETQRTAFRLDKNGYIVTSLYDISALQDCFKKIAVQFGMQIARANSHTTTIKTAHPSSLKCIFLMCLPLGSQDAVYQLYQQKKAKGSRIKIILVSGNQDNFRSFLCGFYEMCWKEHLLELRNYQVVNLLYEINKNMIMESKWKYQEACKMLQNQILQKQLDVQDKQLELITIFKTAQNNLKLSILRQSNCQNINNSYENQTFIQRIIMNDVPIYQFYLKLQNKNNLQFQQKRKQILSKHSLTTVLKHLEIAQNTFGQIQYNNNKTISEIAQQNYPCYQAIRELNGLSTTLSANDNIRYIINFQKKLIESCEIKLQRCSYCIMDMDDQLPLTIYCILLSTNTALKAIVSFLKDYYQNQDLYSNQNRILTTLAVSSQYIRNQWKILQSVNNYKE